MKRTLKIALALCLFLLTCVFTLTACYYSPGEAPKFHVKEVIPAVAPTCTEPGLTEGMRCSVCHDIIVAQEFIAPFGHNAVIDNGVAPTCTTTGFTEGKHCSVCNEVLVAQTIIKANGHTYDNSYDIICNICGEAYSICAHSYINDCDTSCNVCGAPRTPKDHVYSNVCDKTCNLCGATRTVDAHVYTNDCDKTCNVCNATRSTTHTYTNACDPTCDVCEEERTVGLHEYDNACDVDCNVCGATREVEDHVYDNDSDTICNVCNAIRFISEEAKPYVRDGDYIYFGEYPQTIKADDVTITSTQDSRGYYLGSDGYYYAAVTATPDTSPPEPYTFSTGATVISGEVYYFKVEPIRWRILSEDGANAFILCDSIIANNPYEAGYENNYKNSDIRAWLNSTFYETAFTELLREIILTTTVDNSVESTGFLSNTNACEDTEDKIFLLSYREVTNSAYGFSSYYYEYDTARRMQTSDYSRATGAMSTLSDYGIGVWWLRSPVYYNSSFARSVDSDGFVCSIDYVHYSYVGIVPAMWITLIENTECKHQNVDDYGFCTTPNCGVYTGADNNFGEEVSVTLNPGEILYCRFGPANVDNISWEFCYDMHFGSCSDVQSLDELNYKAYIQQDDSFVEVTIGEGMVVEQGTYIYLVITVDETSSIIFSIDENHF